jgi:hypothetical protein
MSTIGEDFPIQEPPLWVVQINGDVLISCCIFISDIDVRDRPLLFVASATNTIRLANNFSPSEIWIFEFHLRYIRFLQFALADESRINDVATNDIFIFKFYF